MKKFQSSFLKVFVVSMILCALLMLFMIWRGGPDNFGFINKLTFTLFIVGLGSFLLWITTTILEIKDHIEKK